jgi:hypothetical protein
MTRTRETATATGPNLSEVEREHRRDYRSEYRPSRRMAFLDMLWRDGKGPISTYGRYKAGQEYERLYLEAKRERSEGVGGYGGDRSADPLPKADRRGKRYTGYTIGADGTYTKDGRPSSNRTAIQAFEDAVFAACGLHDQNGDKRWLPVIRTLMYRVCCDRENPPTQVELTMLLTTYYKETSKQAASACIPLIDTVLGRLELYFGYTK